jgi:hypothetical protein
VIDRYITAVFVCLCWLVVFKMYGVLILLQVIQQVIFIFISYSYSTITTKGVQSSLFFQNFQKLLSFSLLIAWFIKVVKHNYLIRLLKLYKNQNEAHILTFFNKPITFLWGFRK